MGRRYLLSDDTGIREEGSSVGSTPSLIEIFLMFLKIGAFTFGGGYAILPIIQKEIITRQGWVDKRTFLDILVISQSLPGSLALNCSITVGKRLRGIRGGLIAALGIVLPSFLTLLLLAAFLLPKIWENKFVAAIFYGLRPAVVALILAAVWDLGKGLLKDRLSLILFVLLLIPSLALRLHPVLILALGGVLGSVFLHQSRENKKQRAKEEP